MAHGGRVARFWLHPEHNSPEQLPYRRANGFTGLGLTLHYALMRKPSTAERRCDAVRGHLLQIWPQKKDDNAE
jgi:hypothetical protein